MTYSEMKAKEVLESLEERDKTSQNALVLKHLFTVGAITPIEALNNYGCFRLGARIWNLRQLGVPIETQTVIKDGKHYASYRLEGSA